MAGRSNPGSKGMNDMKLCISSTGPELSDLVDPRFGRCRYYVFYDDVSGSHEAEKNTAGMH